jgi:hypothetical protein
MERQRAATGSFGKEAAMSNENIETQPAPNLSTEHQREGDAQRPSDTLDRGQSEPGPDSIEPKTMPGTAEGIEIAGEGSTTGPSG